jgi:hypothetical protein
MDERLEQDLEIEIQRLLEAHLELRLSGQLGRAREAFAAEVRRGRRWWMWLSAGAAMAAGLAIAWGIWGHRAKPLNMPAPQEVNKVQPRQTDGPTPFVHAASWSPFQDEGTVVVENQPMRQWKRTMVEELQYYDVKSKAMVRTRTPREQVYFISMPTD